ncbi:MAG: MBL fold metallo-hydrolase [Rhodobacteraceae bacterium]|nr:MBL fold metallo-hydrolase [Paracoccaceae bacterium]
MKITWCGHSAFVVASDSGLVRLLFDPYVTGSWNGALRYAPIREKCDAIFVSHKHDGHFGYNTIGGNKALIRGYGKFWVHNVHARGVKTWHDDCKGQKRGENTAFSFQIDGVNVAHMGDIGHVLDKNQLEELGPVDVLMVPCGGRSTVDAEGAFGIVEQLQPRVVLPMHFKTESLDADLQGVEPFCGLFSHVEMVSGPLTLTAGKLPGETTLMVMKPKY